MKRNLLVLLGTLLLGAGLFLLRPFPERVKSGSLAPDWNLQGQGALAKKLSDYRGKVVLLNFWATWCPPCRAEMPSLQRLQGLLGEKGFQILAVSVDEEGWPVIQSFLKVVPVSFPVFWDERAEASEAYGVSRLPESFLIDQKGIVVRRYTGPRDWDAPEVVREIEALLRVTHP
ncbi:MAG: TlpA disulfide reductase family protein [Deltaproteobacteria bacterium]|nr:TlpA disulfide reductase family protein [Deltaproteobacteria bacterium]